MAIEIWWIGKKKGYKEAGEYLKRIGKYSKASVKQFKDSRQKDVSQRKAEEAQMLLSKLNTSDHLILLDETGRSLSSKKWSRQLNDVWLRKKRTVFLIGGAFGVDESIFKRAQEVIKLSSLTFPHEMAHLILTEQLYRGFTILNGEKYHHE